MTSIDELFRKPNVPTAGSLKRKFETPDAHSVYKSARIEVDNVTRDGGSKHATTIEDEDDLEAGPDLPPDDEEEDEEGRFFGDGVTADASQALEYLDEVDGDTDFAEEVIDPAWLRRRTANFEKKVVKNAEMRARHESDPSKFMASEADLDADIKQWSLLGEHPELYVDFAQSGSVTTLVNLLAHENADIAIGALEIFSELLDDDIEVQPEQWNALTEAMFEADLMGLLLSNLARLDEDNENDRNGVYHSLAIMEGMASQTSTAERVASEGTLKWLCDRIRSPASIEWQNKQYAAEILQILVQSSSIIRNRVITDMDFVDPLLEMLSTYRKHDPTKDSSEEEFAENLFDALICLVDETSGKVKFVEAEGVELCLIMLKEGGMSKPRSLRLLSHAANTDSAGVGASKVCDRIVEAAGLKSLFGMFVKRSDQTTVEHLLTIQASMLRNLPGDSAARIRLMAKYTEKRFEKVDRLIQLRTDYDRRIQLPDELTFDSLEICLQMIDVILAWICAEEAEARTLIANRIDLHSLAISLQNQVAMINEAEKDESSRDTEEMLSTLIEILN